jgi:hypothetical protein
MSTYHADGFVANDQTGALPRTSNRGMKYVCVFYIYDSNFITGVPIKNRSKEELLRAYKKVYEFCKQRGYKPQLHKLDNETSKEVEKFIASQHANLKYTPPRYASGKPGQEGHPDVEIMHEIHTGVSPPTFPSHTGAASATKWISASTSCASVDKTLYYPPGQQWKASTTSTPRQSHHQAPK